MKENTSAFRGHYKTKPLSKSMRVVTIATGSGVPYTVVHDPSVAFHQMIMRGQHFRGLMEIENGSIMIKCGRKRQGLVYQATQCDTITLPTGMVNMFKPGVILHLGHEMTDCKQATRRALYSDTVCTAVKKHAT